MCVIMIEQSCAYDANVVKLWALQNFGWLLGNQCDLGRKLSIILILFNLYMIPKPCIFIFKWLCSSEISFLFNWLDSTHLGECLGTLHLIDKRIYYFKCFLEKSYLKISKMWDFKWKVCIIIFCFKNVGIF